MLQKRKVPVMIYESTIDNLLMLIRSSGEIKMEQVLHFFRDAVDKQKIPYYIDQLRLSRMLDVDEASGTVGPHTNIKLKSEEVRMRIRAFWVIASFGSANIREITTLGYPSQFLFISDDNEAYDITFCNSKLEAQLAKREWQLSVPKGEIDYVNHIALVSDERVGELLEPYGFTSYCVLEQEHRPRYYTWD